MEGLVHTPFVLLDNGQLSWISCLTKKKGVVLVQVHILLKKTFHCWHRMTCFFHLTLIFYCITETSWCAKNHPRPPPNNDITQHRAGSTTISILLCKWPNTMYMQRPEPTRNCYQQKRPRTNDLINNNGQHDSKKCLFLFSKLPAQSNFKYVQQNTVLLPWKSRQLDFLMRVNRGFCSLCKGPSQVGRLIEVGHGSVTGIVGQFSAFQVWRWIYHVL